MSRFKTDEERKAAHNEAQKRYYKKHSERHKKAVKKWNDNHPERVRAKDFVNNAKENDKKYGRGECTLTTDWIINNIYTSKCFYCGESDWQKLGCDRIDNSKPHTPENVVPCCARCNIKRRGMPFKKFVELVKEYDNIEDVPSQHYESKPVVALDVEGNVVYEFASINETGRNGFSQSCVSRACNGCYLRDGNHQYKGLFWFFKEKSLL